MKTLWRAGGLLVLLVGVARVEGSGMLFPKDESLPALAIKHQRVDIRIKDGTAAVKVEQVFRNSTGRDLEAVYVFPLPEKASIADFAMYIGGKRMSGELVEKDKALRIYQDIVRRAKDPGLLEHLSGNLFRASVYPVPANGEQRIEIAYNEALPYDGGLYRLTYPLKTGEKASQTLEDFTIGATLSSGIPLKSIYSPSHKIGITRKGDHEAVLGFEENRSVLDRDFVLYYGVSQKDFGINLLTHAEKGGDGYFMLLLAPTVEPPKDKVIRRDTAFVFDTSGSMSGDKIKQAREALRYCINKLADGDRFTIVRFSTDVEPFRDELVDVNEENRQAALKFVESLDARGGTDINGALARALAMKRDADRPYTVVFLTDGHPTIGVTDLGEILANVTKVRRDGTRVFVFGVGNGLNTHLLDRLAGDNGGVPQYVLPEEDIEVKVSSFHDKMSHPVLADPRVTVEKVEVQSVHPKKIGDLFAGNQISLLGRYRGDGHVAIRLQGAINGEPKEYVFEGTFPATSAENSFIPRLWATRRVGYLLDEIRLHGEAAELKDEVIKLSKEFGIMTPYTSYLVLEKDDDYRGHGITRTRADAPARAGGAGPAEAPEAVWAGKASGEDRKAANEPLANGRVSSLPPGARPAAESEASRDPFAAGPGDRLARAPAPATVPVFDAADKEEGGALREVVGGSKRLRAADESRLKTYLGRDSGAEAVGQSLAIEAYKWAERAASETASPILKHVGRRLFYLLEGVWTDHKYRKGMKEQRVKYASDEYFKLLSEKPDLRQFFALGEKVIVCVEETAIVVE